MKTGITVPGSGQASAPPDRASINLEAGSTVVTVNLTVRFSLVG